MAVACLCIGLFLVESIHAQSPVNTDQKTVSSLKAGKFQMTSGPKQHAATNSQGGAGSVNELPSGDLKKTVEGLATQVETLRKQVEDMKKNQSASMAGQHPLRPKR